MKRDDRRSALIVRVLHICLGWQLRYRGRGFQAIAKEFFGLYGQAGRYYHGISHIERLLSLGPDIGFPYRKYKVLYLAILYHDIIYKAMRSDNEDLSALHLKTVLAHSRIPTAEIERACGLILSTKNHLPMDQSSEALALLDLDLSILGSGPEEYWAYAEAIRREYEFFPPQEYVKRRADVVRDFLQRPVLFHLPVSREKWELAARENLRAELGRLVPGPA